ncbi:hypothetical protein V2J94_03970 [Streptomyces sp. DSM 41524]|uniref:Glutamate-ammonia ligase adenylyltransferase repeated domain-containing protein n=1 Tax=Streptomyces asiaticus subsp. ignotus TaxID=3098222 RepID=A0ABU7PPP4_9ACTN|nr:hypothetical protein [Streptomyces sp. DSM 41524]
MALRRLVRLAEALPEAPGDGEDKGYADSRQALLDTLVMAKPTRDRLLGVLGISEAPGDHLARHPRHWQALRVAYRRALLAIAARDVCGTTDVTQVAAELADLAAATLRAALEIAAEERPEDAAACRLAVIGRAGAAGGS